MQASLAQLDGFVEGRHRQPIGRRIAPRLSSVDRPGPGLERMADRNRPMAIRIGLQDHVEASSCWQRPAQDGQVGRQPAQVNLEPGRARQWREADRRQPP